MLETKHHALLLEAGRRGQQDVSGLMLCLQILGLATAIDRDCATRLAPHGLTEGRFLLLFLLQGAQAPLSPHELAERAGVSRPTVTGLLDGLQRDGLVERKADVEDGRRWRIVLTRRGQAMSTRLFEAHTAWINGLLAGLDSGEQRMLSGLLAKVYARTDAGGGAAA